MEQNGPRYFSGQYIGRFYGFLCIISRQMEVMPKDHYNHKRPVLAHGTH
jgi:hypothetical protein